MLPSKHIHNQESTGDLYAIPMMPSAFSPRKPMSGHCIFSSSVVIGRRFLGCTLSDVINAPAIECQDRTAWLLASPKRRFGAASLRITAPRGVDYGVDCSCCVERDRNPGAGASPGCQ